MAVAFVPKAYLGKASKDEQSLSLLRRFAEDIGDTSDETAILRQLQNFRSEVGVAHLAGAGRIKG